MCGINGIFLLNQNKLNLKSSIIEMNSTINYRGPDNTNFISEKLFALGHNRLSIIDLDKRSNQPMKDCDGFLYIVFNGEIYNFIEIRNELQKQNIKLKNVINYVNELEPTLLMFSLNYNFRQQDIDVIANANIV